MAKRIAHIVQRMAPGGLEVLVLELTRRLPGKHIVVSLEGTPDGLRGAWPRLASTPAPLFAFAKPPGVAPALLPRLLTLFQRARIDAVVTHHAGPLLYGGVAARLAGVRKLIHVEHDLWHLQAPRRRKVMRLAAAFARPHIVGVSERMRAPLGEAFASAPIDIITNGVDLTRRDAPRLAARERLGLRETDRVVGAAGRLEYVKGHDILLDAFAPLASDAVLVIAGDGSRKRDLVAQAGRLGIGHRVRLVGHRDDLAELYPAFDVFCQPSRNEGLPLAILEAQASNVPVVATEVGDVASALCPATGRLVTPEDAAALSAALAQAIAAPQPRSPRAFIAEKFNLRDTVKGYARLIESA